MKLHMVPAAPNPAKVMLYIAEKEATGVSLNIEQVLVNLPKGAHKTPEYLARNPFGTVPVLELDDGSHLIESLAIIEFLEDLHPQPSFWGAEANSPECALVRARARDVERTVATRVLGWVADYVHSTNSPIGLPPDPEAAANLAQKLPTAWGYVESMLSDGRPFVMGDSVTVADCTLQAALQFMRFAKHDLINDYPEIVRWDQAFRARPGPASVLAF